MYSISFEWVGQGRGPQIIEEEGRGIVVGGDMADLLRGIARHLGVVEVVAVMVVVETTKYPCWFATSV